MKLLLPLALLALNAFAGEVVKETWTCENRNLKFTAVLTESGIETKLKSNYQYDEVGLSLMAGESSLLGEETTFEANVYEGHDSFYYKATLVRGADGVSGKLILVSDMFLDCLGQRVETDHVNCQVVIERK